MFLNVLTAVVVLRVAMHLRRKANDEVADYDSEFESVGAYTLQCTNLPKKFSSLGRAVSIDELKVRVCEYFDSRLLPTAQEKITYEQTFKHEHRVTEQQQ